MLNFIWMCSLYRLPVAKNHNFGQILTFGGLLYRTPFTDEGQIWCATADPRSTLTCKISSECVHCVGFWWPKKHNFGKLWLFGGSCTELLLPMRAKCCALYQTHGICLRAQISSRSVYSVTPCSWKTPIFTVFGLRHLVLSQIGNSLTKLNKGAQP